MGVISWQEIHAWQQATNNKSEWLANVVRMLSIVYIDEYLSSNNKVTQSPYQSEVDVQEKRKAVSRQYHNARKLRMLK